MNYRIMIQGTPNPNALKFVLNVPVKTAGNVTYKSALDCDFNPLAKKIFDVSPDIKEVYFFDNYVTVTQNGNSDWNNIEDFVQKTILDNVAQHNPNFMDVQKQTSPQLQANTDDPELAKIGAILDQTVRPALQADGGDLQLIELKDNVLKIDYQGACGSCPSSTMGTLKAIEELLKSEYNPNIKLEAA